MELTARLSPFFSTLYNQDTDLHYVKNPGYARIDASLTLEKSGGRWGLDLIGKNLTNRVIVTSFPTLNQDTKEPPRNVAIQARFKW